MHHNVEEIYFVNIALSIFKLIKLIYFLYNTSERTENV